MTAGAVPDPTRIAEVLLAAAGEIRRLTPPGDAPAAERLRWRRVATVLGTAAAEIGCPGLFDAADNSER